MRPSFFLLFALGSTLMGSFTAWFMCVHILHDVYAWCRNPCKHIEMMMMVGWIILLRVRLGYIRIRKCRCRITCSVCKAEHPMCVCMCVCLGLCCSPTGQNKTSKTSRLSFINANQCIGNEACESRNRGGCCEWMHWSLSKWGYLCSSLASSCSLTPAAF